MGRLSCVCNVLGQVSMKDVDVWHTMQAVIAAAKSEQHLGCKYKDDFGPVHVVLFGDFKQLPPASIRPPFIVSPAVTSDFEFRVLRQNRRIISGDSARAAELENFHLILDDISHGTDTRRVRDFLVAAYVKGIRNGSADRTDFEGSTSVFTKRRFRDRWNRAVLRRLAKAQPHSTKIKGRVRPQGARGQEWFSERRAQHAQSRSRTQALWNLHLAGSWHPKWETARVPAARPHLMRAMLV